MESFEKKLFKLEKSILNNCNKNLNINLKKYMDIFNDYKTSLIYDQGWTDKCLFKNMIFSKHYRYLDYKIVKSPFKKSKFENNNKLIWYVKKINNKIEGPFNNMQMDKIYNENKLNSYKIGFNKKEFFELNHFINSTYCEKKYNTIKNFKKILKNSNINNINFQKIKNKFDNSEYEYKLF